MVFENGVKNIQAAAYNGARTVYVKKNGCFLGASYYALAAAEGSTHHYLLMAENSNQIGNLSRKHTWVLPRCFLL
jgi:hypothetical protein